MGQIYLVRHGQASFGAADYDRLSETGVAQARTLGEWFAGCGLRFDRAATGTLRRHRQTAEACLFALPDALRPAAQWPAERGFDEYDHNELIARYRPEYADPEAASARLGREPNPRRAFQQVFAAAMARWMGGQHDAEYAETWPTFRARVARALDALIAGAGASQSVIVFTSGGPIAAICQDLLGLPDERAAALNYGLVNSAVTKLLYQAGRDGAPARVSLSYLNNFAHLERTGQADTITYR